MDTGYLFCHSPDSWRWLRSSWLGCEDRTMLGKIAYHAAHKGGTHQFPHPQIMIRTEQHITKSFRIRLGDFFGILPFPDLLPNDKQLCQGARKC